VAPRYQGRYERGISRVSSGRLRPRPLGHGNRAESTRSSRGYERTTVRRASSRDCKAVNWPSEWRARGGTGINGDPNPFIRRLKIMNAPPTPYRAPGLTDHAVACGDHALDRFAVTAGLAGNGDHPFHGLRRVRLAGLVQEALGLERSAYGAQ
jgi:hypothetical protein